MHGGRVHEGPGIMMGCRVHEGSRAVQAAHHSPLAGRCTYTYMVYVEGPPSEGARAPEQAERIHSGLLTVVLIMM